MLKYRGALALAAKIAGLLPYGAFALQPSLPYNGLRAGWLWTGKLKGVTGDGDWKGYHIIEGCFYHIVVWEQVCCRQVECRHLVDGNVGDTSKHALHSGPDTVEEITLRFSINLYKDMMMYLIKMLPYTLYIKAHILYLFNSLYNSMYTSRFLCI